MKMFYKFRIKDTWNESIEMNEYDAVQFILELYRRTKLKEALYIEIVESKEVTV